MVACRRGARGAAPRPGRAAAGRLPHAERTSKLGAWNGARRTPPPPRARAAFGVGGHGVVFPGVNKSSGEIMAIKQVSKKHLPPSD